MFASFMCFRRARRSVRDNFVYASVLSYNKVSAVLGTFFSSSSYKDTPRYVASPKKSIGLKLRTAARNLSKFWLFLSIVPPIEFWTRKVFSFLYIIYHKIYNDLRNRLCCCCDAQSYLRISRKSCRKCCTS